MDDYDIGDCMACGSKFIDSETIIILKTAIWHVETKDYTQSPGNFELYHDGCIT